MDKLKGLKVGLIGLGHMGKPMARNLHLAGANVTVSNRSKGPISELVAEGYDPEIVQQITRLVDLAEYKRRQSPPGPRISMKAFGKDRRLPITNRYR